MSNFEILQSRWAKLQEEYEGQRGILDNTWDGAIFSGDAAELAITRGRELIRLIQLVLVIDDLAPEQVEKINNTILFGADCLLKNAGSGLQVVLTPEEYDDVCDKIIELTPVDEEVDSSLVEDSDVKLEHPYI